MITLENILLIIIILILINTLYTKNNEEPFEIIQNDNINKKKKPIYGDIQYIAKDTENNINFIYQDLDILDLKEDKIIDENMIINAPIKLSYQDNKKIKLPSEDEERYNIKFYQPSDLDINKPFNPSKINYTERKIQDVYSDIINDIKKIYPDKKIVNNNPLKKGGFGENTLSDIEWAYEGETDDNAFDPNLSNLLAL